jgi:molybdopterin-binding protein
MSEIMPQRPTVQRRPRSGRFSPGLAQAPPLVSRGQTHGCRQRCRVRRHAAPSPVALQDDRTVREFPVRRHRSAHLRTRLAVPAVITVDQVRLSRSCGYSAQVPNFRIREAAELLGVSDDTLRRWADAGRIATFEEEGRRVIGGAELAHLAQDLAATSASGGTRRIVGESARNQFVGLVTNVARDTVMAQVDIQAGPYRVVSLMSREAADELKLEPGVIAVASVKATSVVVELPEHRASRPT